jgi:uncharacterized protein
MASGFFAVLDDIALLMDDVAAMGKIATKKTAGILGDDLAVNAEKATGFVSSRELPVLWAITKGSFINKLIILPVTFLLSYFFPVAIKIILVLGGIYLAYEGAEKIIEYFFHHKEHGADDELEDNKDSDAKEKGKIKSAVTTDFILSVEIVIIAFGTVLDKSLAVQIGVVSFVAFVATVGVYGIVALIVRMDDVGLFLIKRSGNNSFNGTMGQVLINLLPWIIKALAVIGTIALLMVAGGIFVHNSEYLHHIFPWLPSLLKEFIVGLIAGLLTAGLVTLLKNIVDKLRGKNL